MVILTRFQKVKGADTVQVWTLRSDGTQEDVVASIAEGGVRGLVLRFIDQIPRPDLVSYSEHRSGDNEPTTHQVVYRVGA